MNIAERLSTIQYQVDETAHIVVNGDLCHHCEAHPCTSFCPAECFTPKDGGGIDYYYVGCVECGTCLLLCSRNAVQWSYPTGGCGIQYRF